MITESKSHFRRLRESGPVPTVAIRLCEITFFLLSCIPGWRWNLQVTSITSVIQLVAENLSYFAECKKDRNKYCDWTDLCSKQMYFVLVINLDFKVAVKLRIQFMPSYCVLLFVELLPCKFDYRHYVTISHQLHVLNETLIVNFYSWIIRHEDYLSRFKICCIAMKKLRRVSRLFCSCHLCTHQNPNYLKIWCLRDSPEYNSRCWHSLAHVRPVNFKLAETPHFHNLIWKCDREIRDFTQYLQTQVTKCNFGGQLQLKT